MNAFRKVIILVLLLPNFLSAQKNYALLLDNYMQTQSKTNEFTGSVLVAKHGKIIYKKAFGMADKEWKIPNKLNSKFEIGSLTKQFTAVCILQLAERGKLNLTDKLNKYFPDFPKADSVTIQMLLNHTSGIKDFLSISGFWRTTALPLAKDSVLAIIQKQPYDFSPGSKWNYSNSNYFILGCIIDKVSGKSYSDYVTENVIHKAGLKNTLVNRWDSVLLYRVKGYSKAIGGWKNANYTSMEIPFSAGAIVSTAEDLYLWENALFSNRLISVSSFTKMTTPYKEHYGYGLYIDTFQHHFRISHGGNIFGFSSSLSCFSKEDIVIVVLSNEENTDAEKISNELSSILFNESKRTKMK
ncbi:MAG: serine hydrolase domain-containing protein [Chitinophagaceae bacterium]